MSASLWVPKGAQEPAGDGKVYICTAPACDHLDDNGQPVPFNSRTEFLKHNKRCAKRSADVLKEAAEHAKTHAFTSPLDKERHEYFIKFKVNSKGKKTLDDEGRKLRN